MTRAKMFFDCGQCGHIGLPCELKDHPDRPVPEDVGFCPECRTELRLDDIVSEERIREVFKSYDEDPDAEIAKIEKRVEGREGQNSVVTSERSSGNVFADLELPNAEHLLAEAKRAALGEKIEKLTQKRKIEKIIQNAVDDILDIIWDSK